MAPPKPFARHAGGVAPAKTTGGAPAKPKTEGKPGNGTIEIIEGTQAPVPHTLMDRHGRHCHTDRWFDFAFLCYNSSLPVEARGGRDDPYMGLRGREFVCYYPGSTLADWRAILASGSSGRWLTAWSQKSAYITL